LYLLEQGEYIMITVQSLFGEKFPSRPIAVRPQDEWSKYVPAATENYYFRFELLADFLAWWEFKVGTCLITGPTGSGKSSLVNEVAARRGEPLFPVVGHNRLEWIDFLGQYIPNGQGGFEFEYGPLPLAMKSGGILLIDEIDLIDPSVLVSLNSILDGRPLGISQNGGEVIHPLPSFKIIATSNSAGHGEGEGNGYTGTLKLNIAFLNRLKWTFRVDYPEPEVENELIHSCLQADRKLAEAMVRFGGEVRSAHIAPESNIPDTLSTRELIEWAYAAKIFRKSPRIQNPLQYALKFVVLEKASEDGLPVMKELFHRVFGDEFIY
jgi:cobaltochelatase CobS